MLLLIISCCLIAFLNRVIFLFCDCIAKFAVIYGFNYFSRHQSKCQSHKWVYVFECKYPIKQKNSMAISFKFTPCFLSSTTFHHGVIASEIKDNIRNIVDDNTRRYSLKSERNILRYKVFVTISESFIKETASKHNCRMCKRRSFMDTFPNFLYSLWILTCLVECALVIKLS